MTVRTTKDAINIREALERLKGNLKNLVVLGTFTVSGKLYVDEDGNVGIGTASPTVPLDANGAIRTRATTVASLPAAGTAGAGARHFVTDANATTFASIVAGGGANGVPVYSDGTNWRIG